MIKKQNVILIILVVIATIFALLLPVISTKLRNYTAQELKVEFDTGYYNDDNSHMFFMDGNHNYSVYDNEGNFYGDPNSFRKIENKKINFDLFNNDSVGFQLVTVTDSLEEFEINLENDNKNINVSVFEEGQTIVGNVSFIRNENFSFSDILTPVKSTVELAGVKVFWIQINTLENLESNKYEFNLEFKNSNNTIANKFSVTTNGIPLVEEINRVNAADFFWNPVSYYDNNIKFMDDKYKEYQEPVLNLKQEFGDDFLFVWGSNMYPTDKKNNWFGGKMTGLIKWIKNKDGNFTFDFTKFKEYIEWSKTLGFKNVMVTGVTVELAYNLKLFGYWDEQTGKYTTVSNNYDTNEYKKAVGQLFESLVNEFKGTEWEGHIYFIMDEPSPSSVEFWNDKLKEVDKNNILKTMLHAGWLYTIDNSNKSQFDFLINNIDILTFGQYSLINYGQGSTLKNNLKALVDKRKENNFKTYTYAAGSGKSPGTIIEADLGDSMYWQLTTKILDLDGEYFWAINKWNFDDMYDIKLDEVNKENFTMGDSFKIYPKRDNNKKIIPGVEKSIRLMQVTNGIKLAEKIEYIKSKDTKLFDEIYGNLIFWNQDNFHVEKDQKYIWYFKGIGKIQDGTSITSTTNIIDIVNTINEINKRGLESENI